MEQEVSNLKTNFGIMKNDIKWIKKSQESMEQKLDDFIDCAPKKFAGKTTEKIIYGMVGIILTTVLTALLYLILLK